MDLLQKEAEALALPCFDLVPAEKGDQIVAHWKGRRFDVPVKFPKFVAALKTREHFLSVEQRIFDELGLKGRGPLALFTVTTAEDDERLDALQVSTKDLSKVSFKGSIPLTSKSAVSIPPLQAVLLYGSSAIDPWLASLGLKRWQYDQIPPEVRNQYLEYHNRLIPLCMEHPPFARIGGWHVQWPDDDFYIPREMRLMIWTFQDSEPWHEVFLSPLCNYVIKSRIT